MTYICLVTLAAYGSIYLNVKDYETKTEMHVNIEYEQQNMVAASILTFLFVLFFGTKPCGRRELGWQHESTAKSEIFHTLFISV